MDVLERVNAEREARLGHPQPIVLISDEPYREITYGAEVPWVPSLYEHTVVCYSYSKSLSLPGERVGWVLVPQVSEGARRVMTAVAGTARSLGFVCAPSLFQRVVMDCGRSVGCCGIRSQSRPAHPGALADGVYLCGARRCLLPVGPCP